MRIVEPVLALGALDHEFMFRICILLRRLLTMTVDVEERIVILVLIVLVIPFLSLELAGVGKSGVAAVAPETRF
jgi:hypothetical protein